MATGANVKHTWVGIAGVLRALSTLRQGIDRVIAGATLVAATYHADSLPGPDVDVPNKEYNIVTIVVVLHDAFILRTRACFVFGWWSVITLVLCSISTPVRCSICLMA